jgi:hypothetical protein
MMSSEHLNSLAKTGLLKPEPPDQTEFNGLLESGTKRLKDACNEANSTEGRFDLAYNAAHALSLAAMRWHGFRPNNRRYIVFQALEHTLGLSAAQWRVLDKAHSARNSAEYEGYFEVDEQLLAEVLKITEIVREKVAALKTIAPAKK